MLITRTSLFSGKTNTLDLPVTEEQFAVYRGGVLIQDAFPNLNEDQREFIMTGMLPDEWEELFEDNDEEAL